MNSGKDLAGDSASRQKQLPAPDAFPKLAAPTGDLRDNAQVAALLQSIAKEISRSDQRHGTDLADLRSRLSLMSERRPASAEPAAAAESTPEPSHDERIPFGHKRPALAIEDHRNAPVDAPLAIAIKPAALPIASAEPVKAVPALSTPRMAAAPPPAASFDHIYASVAEAYAEASRAKGQKAQAAAAVSRPTPEHFPEPDSDDDTGEFLDISALATAYRPLPRAQRPAAIAEPATAHFEAPPAALPKAAVEASLAMQKSISDLAGRISETEQKIALAARHPDDAKALTALSAQIEGLRTELEKLVTEHEAVSVKVGHVSANVTALAEAAGRIGPLSDSIGLINEAILTLRKELPSIAETTATRTSSKVAETLAGNSGHAELSEKLAIVQNLLLSQARDHQETDGRSFGALQSIRGLVENLHNRIDALESADPVELAPEPLPPVQARAMVSPAAAKPALSVHVEPPFEDGDTGLLRTASSDQPHAAAPAMSREDLIASARRAAAAMASQPAPNVSDRLRTQTADLRALATPKPATSPFAMLGSRRVVTVAMVALLAAALGMVFTKVMRKPAPVATVEQTALPDIPDDIPDTMPAKKPQTSMAPASKDASKPAATPAQPADSAMPKAVPRKDSALEPGDLSPPAANAASLPMASEAVVIDGGTPVEAQPASLTTAPEPEDLPAAIAPLSLRTAALAGDPIASYTIADRFLAGKGVARDPGKASRWYEQSAKSGLPLAEFKLGVLYERGDEGVTADRGRAQAWYQKGAQHGNVQAMHNLAVLFTAQSGGEPDYTQAAKWFEQAANYGLKDSQYNLAVLYENGLGVTKSVMTAYKWLAIDAAHGDAEAAKRRDGLRKQIPVAMLSTIEAQAKSWHAKQPELKANTIDAMAANTVTVPALDSDVTASAAQEVGTVQQMLSKLGYDPGTLDGTLTAQTRDAIRTFEGRSGLQPTGEISPALVRKLKSLAG